MNVTTILGPEQRPEISLPTNVRVGTGSMITGDHVTASHMFRRFRSRIDPALVIGRGCFMDGVLFNLGEQGRILIGDDCRFDEAVLVCEAEILVGNRVILGWRATVVDADFHPIDPKERLIDAVACSPVGEGLRRPPFTKRSVVIEDDVWVGPQAVILKGVRVGTGAFIEPGAVVVRDVPPRARILGNPGQIIGEV
jgi:acetyltransferase-like isoleucine patch superfamily enzyme